MEFAAGVLLPWKIPKGDEPAMSIAVAAAAIRIATGPRTPEGKAISSQNALKHGLTAKSPLLPSEDPAEFEAFVQEQIEAWRPEGADFHAMVIEYADLTWRLNRAARHEARLIAIEVARMQIDRRNDPKLDELIRALGQNDPLVLESLAFQHLVKSGVLTNLFRQERYLNRRREKVIQALVNFSRIVEQNNWLQKRHDRRQRELEEAEKAKQKTRASKAARKAASSGVQNELPDNPESGIEKCLRMTVRA